MGPGGAMNLDTGRSCSWEEPLSLSACLGAIHQIVLLIVLETQPSDRRRGRKLGSWKAPFRIFSACIGTMNRVWSVHSFPMSCEYGSWKAPFRFFARIGTMNLIGLLV